MDGQILKAFTYISYNLTDTLPTKNYMAYIIGGAEEHDLPEDYVGKLMEIETK